MCWVVRSEGQSLVFGVGIGTVAVREEEAIEGVVTGAQEGYNLYFQKLLLPC